VMTHDEITKLCNGKENLFLDDHPICGIEGCSVYRCSKCGRMQIKGFATELDELKTRIKEICDG